MAANQHIPDFMIERIDNARSRSSSFCLATIATVLTASAFDYPTNTAAAGNHAGSMGSAAKTEVNTFDFEMNQSKRSFRLGELSLKPHPRASGIDAFTVYRGKRLILRKSLHRDFKDGDFMWLTFPYTRGNAKKIHTFDGSSEDFIAQTTFPGQSPFADLNGDGIPEIVVTYNYGNAGHVYTIFSLGKKAMNLAKFETIRSELRLIDIDKDGKCEGLASDPTFIGWKTCNASSPMPLVILKLVGRKFTPATSLMKTKPPDKERQQKLLEEWRTACRKDTAEARAYSAEKYDDKTLYLAPGVWRIMLDLIYSGNSKVAFDLLDQFWKRDASAGNLEHGENCTVVRTSKETFRRMFLEKLSQSPYLNEIKQLNKGDEYISKLTHKQNKEK